MNYDFWRKFVSHICSRNWIFKKEEPSLWKVRLRTVACISSMSLFLCWATKYILWLVNGITQWSWEVVGYFYNDWYFLPQQSSPCRFFLSSFLNKPITRLEPATQHGHDRPQCTDNGLRGQVKVGLFRSQDNQEQSGMAGAPRMETSGYEQSCLGLLIQLASLETVIYEPYPTPRHWV